jgi:hypothetical protein
MHMNKTAIERAFELARSGRFAKLEDIKAQLKLEGYSDAQVIGPTLFRQLRKLISEAKNR